MNSSVLLTFFIILGVIYTITALKNDECEGKLIFYLLFVYYLILSLF